MKARAENMKCVRKIQTERGEYKSIAQNIKGRAENITCVRRIEIERGKYKSIAENIKARAEKIKCVQEIQIERGKYKSRKKKMVPGSPFLHFLPFIHSFIAFFYNQQTRFFQDGKKRRKSQDEIRIDSMR